MEEDAGEEEAGGGEVSLDLVELPGVGASRDEGGEIRAHDSEEGGAVIQS